MNEYMNLNYYSVRLMDLILKFVVLVRNIHGMCWYDNDNYLKN